MQILPVTEEDAGELLEIYRPYVEKTAITFEYETPSVEEFKNRIKSISSTYPYLKAVDDNGKIVGYAYAGVFKGRKAYERSVETTVYVAQNHHHDGIGRTLYEALEEKLKQQGILNMYACIAYPKSQDDPYLTMGSPRFHERLGFTTVGTFHDCAYKFSRWYDMIWMEKMIGPHD